MRDRKKIPLVRGLRFEDLLRFPEDRCLICNKALNGENWSQSRQKRMSFICRVCASQMEALRRGRNLDEEKETINSVSNMQSSVFI